MKFWRVDEPVMERFLEERLVAVAEVVMRRLETVVGARVDEPVAMRLFELAKTMVEEVAFSPEPRVTNGKLNDEPEVGQLERQSPFKQRLVVAKLVEVAEVVVAVEAVKDERVEEAVEMKPFKRARVVEVAFSPVPSFVNG